MPENITDFMITWSNCDREALDKLVPLIYSELRRLAGYYLRNERQNHSLQATALVNEAYMRLVECEKIEWKSRAHFLGVAAQLMRNILVDHARKNRAAKRGGGDIYKISLDKIPGSEDMQDVSLIDLDNALVKLASFDLRQSQIIEFRYFGGLTCEEIGEILGISPATVSREEKLAKLLLMRELSKRA
jgi:RNA polymerase sigma factor (TIGR02999 family)